LAKRLSEKQKEEILQRFLNGDNLDLIAVEFGFTKFTISRNLKKILGDESFNELVNKNKSAHKANNGKEKINYKFRKSKLEISHESISSDKKRFANEKERDFSTNPSCFAEIVPLDYQIDNESRKDLSSISLDQAKLPETVFMIVDKKIELQTKLLKDYAEWQFLPENDLNFKTIEIYAELKDAKRVCNKEQKVIKVPNTKVFKIASKIMRARGIKRIVSDNQLIAI
tara:strand:+ start:888 stop:1568 length:681 start_codon:yes stop_codon:yes gene_type:complete